MTNIDIAQFKAEFPELRAKQNASSKPLHKRPDVRSLKSLQAVRDVYADFYQKAGLDLKRLDELARHVHEDARVGFKADNSTAANQIQANQAAFLQRARNRDTALKLLAKPFLSYYEILTTPFLIWELPHPELSVFVNSQIAAQNSWAKVLVDTNRRSDTTLFNFYFYWENPSDYYALMNVSSALILNGVCQVTTGFKFAESDTAQVYLTASLGIWRWIGWGTDPTTGANLDQTLLTTSNTEIAYISAGGDANWDNISTNGQVFPYALYDVSYNLLAVPPGASVLFEVGMQMSYDFDIGGIDDDKILIDFASDSSGREILCREVDLEMLVPLESLKTI
jgi:hypothetical protein